jgi:cell wall-associated NlpC family hydrolase
MQRRKLLRNIFTTLAAGAATAGGVVGVAQAKPQTHPNFPHNWQEKLAQQIECSVTYGEQRGDLLYAEVNGSHNSHFALYSPNGEDWYNTPKAIPHWQRTLV